MAKKQKLERNVAVLTVETDKGTKQTGFLLENDDQLRALESVPQKKRLAYAELNFEVSNFRIERGRGAAVYPAIVSVPKGRSSQGYAVTDTCERFEANKAALQKMLVPHARPAIIEMAFPAL